MIAIDKMTLQGDVIAAPKTAVEHKSRFVVLDGLRGVAAVAVLLFHGNGWLPRHAFSHGYLAVDFFFMLSGFVIPYAYEARLKAGRLVLSKFAVLRLIRLYPLIWLGTLIGLAGFLVRHGAPTGVGGAVRLAALTGLSLLALPATRGLAENPAPLNGPSWSLTCEVAINLAYAAFVRFLSTPVLVLLMLAALGGDVWASLHVGLGQVGATFTPSWTLVARTAYPFLAGLLIFRLHAKGRLPRAPAHPYLLAAVLLAVLGAPPTAAPAVYELACLVLIFPVVVILGAGRQAQGRTAKVAEASAAISFPLYAVHYPFVLLFLTMQDHVHLAWRLTIACYLLLVIAMIALAAVLAPVDAHVRRWLSERLLGRMSAKGFMAAEPLKTGL